MDWLADAVPSPDSHYQKLAEQRQSQLTKPPGSLGYLEVLAIRLAALQASECPVVKHVHVSVFAADHGVAEASVSAFPQQVTREMVKNFARGGAAVNVLSRFVNADFEVIDCGLKQAISDMNVINDSAGNGTANFIHQSAMTQLQLEQALNAGRKAACRAQKKQADLFIGGEMGIANTTSATALACALLEVEVAQLVGAGTGLNSEQIIHKMAVIEKAIHTHQKNLTSPLGIMQILGGFEIAALTGAYIQSAQNKIPVLVDGFIATVAALYAIKINANIKDWLFFSHCSHEQGHQFLLDSIPARPLLNLDMRLGEASGALVAVPLMQMACRLHNDMATFQEAGITT